MDKVIESFEEFIDGAVDVSLGCTTMNAAGVTVIDIVVQKPGDEYDDEGCATQLHTEKRHVGFARRKAAKEALGNMRKALIEKNFKLEADFGGNVCSYSKWSHENDW